MTGRLLVHVGVQPSGEVLGPALAALAPQLQARGVTVLDAADLPPTRLAQCIPAGTVLVHSSHRRRAVPEGMDDVEAYCDFDVAELTQLARHAPLRMLLCPVRQDRALTQAYLDRVRAGAAHDLDAQFPRLPHLDYPALADRLASLGDLRVRPFELVGAGVLAVVLDALAALGIDTHELDLTVLAGALTAHRPWTLRGVRVAVAMNGQLDTDEQRARVREFVTGHFAGGPGTVPTLLPLAQRRGLLAAHHGANRRLFTRYAPDLPPDAYRDARGALRLAAALPARSLPAPPPTAPAGRAWAAVRRRVIASTRRAQTALGLDPARRSLRP